MTEQQRVTVEITDGVADVRLARPDKRNALDGAMFAALVTAGERSPRSSGSARPASLTQADKLTGPTPPAAPEDCIVSALPGLATGGRKNTWQTKSSSRPWNPAGRSS